jgi:hypothetical protein
VSSAEGNTLEAAARYRTDQDILDVLRRGFASHHTGGLPAMRPEIFAKAILELFDKPSLLREEEEKALGKQVLSILYDEFNSLGWEMTALELVCAGDDASQKAFLAALSDAEAIFIELFPNRNKSKR